MIKYTCRYCGQQIGEINEQQMDIEQLGLHSLTPSEQKNIITYKSNGDIIAKVICEYCQETLEENPELLLISNPLQ